ncbi:hypothetical protein QR680_016673 [Steinernema hermaphroditum]|uniref:Uncharacterized protein n=1 Tax=Steinernema hermaphroditum TaxID=289476 RepID=A0AA39HCB7_9BILA|nr:hypothetical protein QR680_016673 [Steinernema hermaphroditum]
MVLVPSFVVSYQEATNKREFLRNFLANSSFSILLLTAAFYLLCRPECGCVPLAVNVPLSSTMEIKWAIVTGLLLLAGICIVVYIPSTVVAYQEATNKREFLGNFLSNASFGIFLLIVAFLLGDFGAKIDTSHRNKRFILRLWPRCITLTFCHEIITIKDEKEWPLARIEPTEDLKRELEERIRALEAENRDLQEQLRLSAERVEEMEQEPSVLQHMIFKKERLGGILVAIGILAIVVSVAFAYVYQITAN